LLNFNCSPVQFIVWLNAGTARRQERPVRLSHWQQRGLWTRASDSPVVQLLKCDLQHKLGISALQRQKVLSEFKHLGIISQFSVSSEKGITCDHSQTI